MATPSDQHLLDLLGKWLESLELHIKYSSLDDDSYSKVQPWPEHQRPSRWILDLARSKTLALRQQIDERVKLGDVKFSDALELMAFLANLVGAEHIERFIPLADPATERVLPLAPPDGHPAAPATAATGTREMPKFQGKARVPAPSATAQVVRTERRASKAPAKSGPGSAKAAPEAAAAPAPAHKAAPPRGERAGPSDAAREQVVNDAARLVQWGRKWYELAELIARMADRPPLPEVRRILKDNKTAIDKKAGRG
jgi:hypothetical protein